MQLWFYEDFAEICHFNCANPGILFLGLPEPRVVVPAQTQALIFLRDVDSHLHAEFEPEWPRDLGYTDPGTPGSLVPGPNIAPEKNLSPAVYYVLHPKFHP